ncbi:uncharacterized protein LOC106653587 [Trichogramma pretiosum]|uniref:uncharacterized protein LOC106653587 n=1 Tax=Trichogramma pretiosum TaxID=7493 RepID=UPI0006C9A392|nr:uncharacterized protein LOC106653587 [Trichogramma pretiosum]
MFVKITRLSVIVVTIAAAVSGHLVYPDPHGSETKMQVLFGLGLPMEEDIAMTLGYVLKCNYNMPTNVTTLHRHDEVDSAHYRGWSVWQVYEILAKAFGRGCLLRSICEAAESPLIGEDRTHERHRDGLLAELIHLLLSPSIAASNNDNNGTIDNDETEKDHRRAYLAAEAQGRERRDCRDYHEDCPRSPLDYFTETNA